MALSQKERQQVLGALIVLAVLAVVGFWMLWRSPKVEQMAEVQVEIDSTTTRVNAAERILKSGMGEQLQQAIATYQTSLGVMRRLVPSANEVPDVLDDIASRARVRGVDLREFERQPPQPVGPFQLYRYNYTVTGYYDQIARFITDVASLPRIMVPTDVALGQAPGDAQRLAGDTTGALLQATLQIRTFVKAQGGGGSSESQ